MMYKQQKVYMSSLETSKWGLKIFYDSHHEPTCNAAWRLQHTCIYMYMYVHVYTCTKCAYYGAHMCIYMYM